MSAVRGYESGGISPPTPRRERAVVRGGLACVADGTEQLEVAPVELEREILVAGRDIPERADVIEVAALHDLAVTGAVTVRRGGRTGQASAAEWCDAGGQEAPDPGRTEAAPAAVVAPLGWRAPT